MGTGYFRGLKRPGHGADHQSTSSAQLELGLLVPFVPALTCRGVAFAFYRTYIPPQILLLTAMFACSVVVPNAPAGVCRSPACRF